MPNHSHGTEAQVDYDSVAPSYDKRYGSLNYRDVERAVAQFVGPDGHCSVFEIGCGTGHWLAALKGRAGLIAGVDRSWQMLLRARSSAPTALLAQASAEVLPFGSARFDRALCVNALHHFPSQPLFIHECRRVLRPGGAFLTIGLDPHTGDDQWWIYDYFPHALELDCRRYASTERIREMLVDAGFSSPVTEIVQHLPAERTYEQAQTSGLLDRHSTSQLMVITDAEYDAGLRRLARERPVLRADLRLFGTYARVEAAS